MDHRRMMRFVTSCLETEGEDDKERLTSPKRIIPALDKGFGKHTHSAGTHIRLHLSYRVGKQKINSATPVNFFQCKVLCLAVVRQAPFINQIQETDAKPYLLDASIHHDGASGVLM